jgi:hypothetical protein
MEGVWGGVMLHWVCRDRAEYLDLAKGRFDLAHALHNEHFHLVSNVRDVAYIVENQHFTSGNLLGEPA